LKARRAVASGGAGKFDAGAVEEATVMKKQSKK
jgi:hypothetical protein